MGKEDYKASRPGKMRKPISESILLTFSPPIAEIKIKGKQGLNILDRKLLQSLRSAIDRLNKEQEIKIAILFSGSKKGFAAGANMHELKNLDTKEAIQFSKMGQDLFCAMEEMAIVFVGVVDGYCIGGGFDLALACDLLIFSQKASFQHPGTSRGFITGFGGNFRLAEALGRQKSIQILISGNRLSAEKIANNGLSIFLNRQKSIEKQSRDRIDFSIDALSYARKIAKKLSVLNFHQIDLVKKLIRTPASISFKNKAFMESSLSILYSLRS